MFRGLDHSPRGSQDVAEKNREQTGLISQLALL